MTVTTNASLKRMDSKSNQSFVILGGSGDIGTSVAEQLRRDGKRILLGSRPSRHLVELAARLDCPTFELDATRPDEVLACLEQASNEFGRVDGVVNCVGSILLKPAHLTTEQEWSTTIATNLTSAFATVRAAAKTMLKLGGSVVLVSSAAADVGLPSHEAIAAAKAGVVGLARSAAASYAARGLRINVVAPGLVRTKLTRKIWENERAAATSQAMHPIGRLGDPSEVAAAIVWLLDSQNSWTTGEVIAVDGGLAHVRAQVRSR